MMLLFGMENLFVRYWWILMDVLLFVEMFEVGSCVCCDVGEVNGCVFLLYVFVGFDVEVVWLFV